MANKYRITLSATFSRGDGAYQSTNLDNRSVVMEVNDSIITLEDIRSQFNDMVKAMEQDRVEFERWRDEGMTE